MATRTQSLVKVTLRKIGGSLTATLPADMVKEMNLRQGQQVKVAREGRKITLEPVKMHAPKRYTLKQILASCDFSLPKSEDEIAWENAPRMGREVI
jgi:antitoxin component of MazEF toxin-antitoxin module